MRNRCRGDEQVQVEDKLARLAQRGTFSGERFHDVIGEVDDPESGKERSEVGESLLRIYGTECAIIYLANSDDAGRHSLLSQFVDKLN